MIGVACRSLRDRSWYLLHRAASYVHATVGADLILTDKCVQKLKEVAEKDEFLRILVDGGGCSGFEYKMRIDKMEKDDDFVFEKDGAKVVVDRLSLEYMKGSTLDYSEDLMKAAFRVTNNPVAAKGCSCGSSFAPKMD